MTAPQLFTAMFTLSIAIMVVALVAGLGLSLSLNQILLPLRRVWILIATVIANIVLIPLMAIGICHATRTKPRAATVLSPVATPMSGVAR